MGIPVVTFNIRLNPAHTGLVLEDDSSGREFPIPATADGMDLLMGVLRRDSERRSGIAITTALTRTEWPPGLPVRFVPPCPSPWREAAFFPKGADYAEGTVVAPLHNADNDGYVCCQMGDGKTYALPPRHLRVQGRTYTAKGKVQLSLEDLGL